MRVGSLTFEVVNDALAGVAERMAATLRNPTISTGG